MLHEHLRRISVAKHRIQLSEELASIQLESYRDGLRHRQSEKDDVNKSMKDSSTEAATSKRASPFVFALRKARQYAVLSKLSKLNAVIIKDRYPMVRFEKCIDSPGTANVFSTLGVSNSYWWTELDKINTSETAFVTHNELYKYTGMSLGLKNMPVTFQRAIDTILAPVKWKHAPIYIDNAIICSKNPGKHLAHVESVF